MNEYMKFHHIQSVCYPFTYKQSIPNFIIVEILKVYTTPQPSLHFQFRCVTLKPGWINGGRTGVEVFGANSTFLNKLYM